MHEKLHKLLIRRAMIIPTSEIYNPVAGFYDYGPIAVNIKRKVVDLWRQIFIEKDGFLEIDGATVLQEIALKASGHVDNFNDPMTECQKCHKRFRVDHLVEDALGIDASHMSISELGKVIAEKNVICPSCGAKLGQVKPFNLMFETQIGPVDGITAYLRPETAQNIFMNFNKIFNAFGAKLPMGIGQVGRAYRNEISPRQSLIRVREFHQMELEYFFDPEEDDSIMLEKAKNVQVPMQTRQMQREGKSFALVTLGDAYKEGYIPAKTMAYFMAKERELLNALGIRDFRIRHLMEDETPHYSGGNFDVEIATKFGWVEVMSLAYRTNYDLVRHSKFSGKNLQVTVNDKKVMPHVIEPSIGLGRLLWCVLEHAYVEDKERGWDWLNLPPKIAPYDICVLPLMKNSDLVRKAKEICDNLKPLLDVSYEQSGSIGKRYAKADEIGVPYCATVDYQTLEDNTVTIRFRNDGKQIRIPIGNLAENIRRWKLNGIVEASKSGYELLH